jgi:hypothetical protein
VEWLDKPFLQRSAFELLAGRKGSCKGTWLCGVAARVSDGSLYGEPKRVLVVTSEDSVELDFLPRFLAAGGDPAMVEIIVGAFRLPRDLDWLRQQAASLGDVGLIVIDPIGNHLGGADTDKEGSVREAIGPLNDLADQLDCLIVGVRHLGKDASRGALSSVLGSTAWVDVPRCVILMAPDDEDDLVYHAQVVAGNRGPKRSAARAYRLELVDVPPAREITRLADAGASDKDVEDLLGDTSSRNGRAPKRDAAADAIVRALADGPKPLATLKALCAADIGASSDTTYRAANQLKAEGRVTSRNSGPGTPWLWELTA